MPNGLSDRQLDILLKDRQKFCKLLDEALPDEKSGAHHYEMMIEAAHQSGYSESVKKTLNKIMNDEHKHRKKLEKLHRDLCPARV